MGGLKTLPYSSRYPHVILRPKAEESLRRRRNMRPTAARSFAALRMTAGGLKTLPYSL